MNRAIFYVVFVKSSDKLGQTLSEVKMENSIFLLNRLQMLH